MTTTTLADRDLEAVLGFLDDAYQDDPGEVVPWALLDGLNRLIGADSVQLCELDIRHRAGVQQQYVDGHERGVTYGASSGEDVAESVAGYFRNGRDFLACTYPIHTGDLRS